MKKFRYSVTIIQKGKQWSKTVDKVPFIIGRGPTSDVELQTDVVSREHIRVHQDALGFWLEDLGSSNGTYLEGKKMMPKSKVLYIAEQKISIGQQPSFFLTISAKEVVESKVIEFPTQVAEEIPQKKVANGPSLPATRKASPPPMPAEEKSEDLSGMSSDEKKLFEQIKKMVGNESQEIHRRALQKAQELEQKAEAESQQILSDAKAEASRMLKSNEEIIARKLKDLNSQKNQLEKDVSSLETELAAKRSDVQALSVSEDNHKAELERLEQAIIESQERYRLQAEEAEALIATLKQDRNKFESEYEDFKLDERKIRSKLEAEVLEAKVRSLQIQTETAQLQESIEHLKPQLVNLNAQKIQGEEELKSLRQKIQQEEFALSALKLEHQQIQGQMEFLRSENARFEAQAQQLVEDARLEAKDLIEKSEVRASALIDQANDQYRELKNTYQAELDKLEAIKLQLAQDIELKRMDAVEEGQRLIKDAEVQVADALVRKNALEVEILTLTRERTQKIEDIKKEANHVLERAQVDAAQMMKQAEESANLILTRERSIFEEEQSKRRMETEAVLESARRSSQEILAQAEVEARENRLKQQQILAELKQVTMFEIKELKAKAEDDILKRKHDHAKNVSTNVYALVANEMFKSKDKVLDVTLIEEFTKGLKELISDTMLDRASPDDDKLQGILKVSADAKSKEQNYWRRVKSTAMASVFAIITLIAFPQIVTYPKAKIIAAFTEKSTGTSDEFLNQVKEARIKAIYNPATTPEFKSSYYQNVLFTTDFLTKLQSEAYQDKWILELNDYFIKSLDVKDTTIIKFVSLESSLLKDLVKLKESVDPKAPEAKIEEMKVREQEYRKKLAEIFEDPEKVSRYYQFHEKFWNEFYHPRRPAQQVQP